MSEPKGPASPTPRYQSNSGAYVCPKCRRSIDEGRPMVEMIVLITRSRKTRVWVCVECLLGSEALDHPAISLGRRAAHEKQERLDRFRDQQKAARQASRFDHAQPDDQENDFVPEGAPEEVRARSAPSSFVPTDTLSARLGVPKDAVKKLVKHLEIDIVDHDGKKCVKRESFERMEHEIRRRLAKKRQGQTAEKYADQVEAEKANG